MEQRHKKIQKYCIDAGLPEPTFEEYQRFQVVFKKDVYENKTFLSLQLKRSVCVSALLSIWQSP
jgi:predicted HTH transcriptional regulator